MLLSGDEWKRFCTPLLWPFFCPVLALYLSSFYTPEVTFLFHFFFIFLYVRLLPRDLLEVLLGINIFTVIFIDFFFFSHFFFNLCCVLFKSWLLTPFTEVSLFFFFTRLLFSKLITVRVCRSSSFA